MKHALVLAVAVLITLPAFEEADRNGDGSVSAAEASFVRGLWLRFTEADRDGDRALSRQEYERWRPTLSVKPSSRRSSAPPRSSPPGCRRKAGC